MSKSRRRRNKDNWLSTIKPLLYWGVIGGILLAVVALLVTQNQPQSGQVNIDGGRPAWQTIALTDARTGETLTLADFTNKNVFVKIMSPF